MKTTIVNKIISIGIAGSISFSFLMADEALEPAPNMADELEEAIFLHEAKLDFDAAIKKYQEILETDALVRTIAAEAQFRLAECYWEQGNKAQAQIEYEKLVATYPAEEKWISAASERLPVEMEATINPIVDGERFLYRFTLPTGVVFGYSETKNYSIVEDGRKLWRHESRRQVGGRAMMTVDIDPVTNASVRSAMFSEQMGTVFGEFSDDGKSVTIDIAQTKEVKELTFPKQTYDNEQAMELLRQFPVEVGYRTSFDVFVSFSSMRMPVVCEVIEIQEMDTIFGSVECYKVQIEVGGTQQYISITTDDRRIPVEMNVGGVVVTLVLSDFYEKGRVREYSNERYGFSFNYDDEWTLFEDSNNGGSTLERIHFLAPGGLAHLEVLSNVNEAFDVIVPGDFQATVNGLVEREQGKWKQFDFGEEPYSIRTVNGLDAVFFKATRFENEQPVEEFAAYFILGETHHYSFVFLGSTSDWEKLEEDYVEIAESVSE